MSIIRDESDQRPAGLLEAGLILSLLSEPPIAVPFSLQALSASSLESNSTNAAPLNFLNTVLKAAFKIALKGDLAGAIPGASTKLGLTAEILLED